MIIKDIDNIEDFMNIIEALVQRGIGFRAYPKGECWEIVLTGAI